MKTYTCVNCGKITPDGSNYCDWDCHIELAVKEGGVKHQPNGLPIRSIKYENSMWEHEHGDHRNYKFPVDVELHDDAGESCDEIHAFIYTDGQIAMTIYECQYFLWSLFKGRNLDKLRYPTHILSMESREKILDYAKKEKLL